MTVKIYADFSGKSLKVVACINGSVNVIIKHNDRRAVDLSCSGHSSLEGVLHAAEFTVCINDSKVVCRRNPSAANIGSAAKVTNVISVLIYTVGIDSSARASVSIGIALGKNVGITLCLMPIELLAIDVNISGGGRNNGLVATNHGKLKSIAVFTGIKGNGGAILSLQREELECRKSASAGNLDLTAVYRNCYLKPLCLSRSCIEERYRSCRSKGKIKGTVGIIEVEGSCYFWRVARCTLRTGVCHKHAGLVCTTNVREVYVLKVPGEVLIRHAVAVNTVNAVPHISVKYGVCVKSDIAVLYGILSGEYVTLRAGAFRGYLSENTRSILLS